MSVRISERVLFVRCKNYTIYRCKKDVKVTFLRMRSFDRLLLFEYFNG